MSRFAQIDLTSYPIEDVLEALAFESYLARDRADFATRWAVRRAADPTLPAIDTLLLESDPASVVLEAGSARELLLRARINDAIRQLTLAGATGRALDHIGATYYRTERRVITPASGTTPAVMEDDETYRRRLAIAPESWSTCGPEGAYLFWGLSASGDVLDLGVYSEDEGVALAPHVRVALLSRLGDGTASGDLIQTVQTALRRRDIRPMGDLVTVETAVPLEWSVEVRLHIAAGASPALVSSAARKRLEAYVSGRLRWIGDDVTGPVFLVGRRFSVTTIAAAAQGGDSNILSVEVVWPVADVNAPAPGYDAALAGVGSPSFQALSQSMVQHLFAAPRCVSITVDTQLASGGWS